MGAVATGAGSTTLPTQALVGGSTTRLMLRELSIVNTTAVTCTFKLVRLTAAGTPGTSLGASPYVTEGAAAVGVVRQVYTSTAPTQGADLGYRFIIPASIGAGVVRTFNEPGIAVPMVAAAALALVADSGTPQICAIDWTWDE